MNYSVEFFILSDEGKEGLFTYGTGDITEGNEGLTRENLIVPGVTSEEIFKTNSQDNVDVTITKTNGDKQNYQIKLDATEVTQTINNN